MRPETMRGRPTGEKIRNIAIQQNLYRVLEGASVAEIGNGDRLVILSDLHVGNRGRRDDFLRNSRLTLYVLEHYYLKHRFRLLLNGDVEELHRYSLPVVLASWPDLYDLLGRFEGEGRLGRVIGNHDFEITQHEDYPLKTRPVEGLLLRYHRNSLLVFHGHQASLFQERLGRVTGPLLRYVARPLGIRSFSVSHHSGRRIRTEKRVYDFSIREEIISIIGHTHRPLFESLSRADYLRLEIEALCRNYPRAGKAERERLAADIRRHRDELDRLYAAGGRSGFRGSLYNARLLVPCLFNSGTAIGRRGITAIEIVHGRISLVHWFDRGLRRRHLRRITLGYDHAAARQLGDSGYSRIVLKRDSLDMIFTRIHLLAG